MSDTFMKNLNLTEDESKLLESLLWFNAYDETDSLIPRSFPLMKEARTLVDKDLLILTECDNGLRFLVSFPKKHKKQALEA